MRRRLFSIYRVALLLLLFVAVAAVAQAGLPNSPDSLVARVDYSNGTNDVQLFWMANYKAGAPVGYNIYQASGTTSNLSSFSKIGSVSDTNTWGIMRTVTNLSIGDYSFYVTAYNNDGESQPSRIGYASVTEFVRFTTYAGDTARVGNEYVYDANAVGSLGSTLQYELIGGPTGMTIDQSNGIVRWTPAAGGDYQVGIRASVMGTTISATQGWNVHAYFCQIPATISGTVRFGNGDPVTEGMVTVMHTFSTPAGDSAIVVATTMIDPSNGTYSAHVDADGDFIVKVDGSLFDATWNPNAASGNSATRISVSCGTTSTADITVERTNYMAIGRVTRTLNGRYVNNMPIKFWRVGTNDYYTTNTRDSGNYSIALPKDQMYIAYADAGLWEGYGQSLLMPQYFDHVSDLASATQIDMSSDQNGIDFSLAERPTFNNSISGYIKDSAGMALTGRIDVYQIEESGGTVRYELMQTVVTDSVQGLFHADNLLPGTYVVRAQQTLDFDSSFAPGYYKEGDFAVPSWQDATNLTVTSNQSLSGLVIKLHAINGRHGKARLRGTIVQSAGKAEKQSGSTQSVVPAVGVMVTAIDANNQVSGYIYTDQNGFFDLGTFTTGTYTIVADKVGLKTYHGTETFNSDGETRQTEVTMQTSSTSSVVIPGNGTTGDANLLVYPNPATSNVRIRFATQPGTARLILTDALGRQLFSTTLRTTGVESEYLFDAGTLTSGVYMIRVESGSTTSSVPVHIVR